MYLIVARATDPRRDPILLQCVATDHRRDPILLQCVATDHRRDPILLQCVATDHWGSSPVAGYNIRTQRNAGHWLYSVLHAIVFVFHIPFLGGGRCQVKYNDTWSHSSENCVLLMECRVMHSSVQTPGNAVYVSHVRTVWVSEKWLIQNT